MHLYETHVPVADTAVSAIFYQEVLGLMFAHRDPTRDVVFLWADGKQKGMIGLWGASTGYGRKNGAITECHLAFAVSLEELRRAITQMHDRGIETRAFGGNATREPSVIGWMPSAQIYFRDPDGHLLELITLLPQAPVPGFAGTYTEWLSLTNESSHS